MITYSPYKTASINLRTPYVGLSRINSIIVSRDSAWYEAFPNMIALPNGSWMITYMKYTNHSIGVGATLQKRISTDHGLTWSAESLFYSFLGPSDWHFDVVGTRVFFFISDEGATHKHLLKYSDDNCVTWSSDVLISSTHFDNKLWLHSRFVIAPNGDYLMPTWGVNTGTANSEVMLMKSVDQGMTWSDFTLTHNSLEYVYWSDGMPAPGWLSEPTMIYAPNGKLLLFRRGNGLILTSEDDGVTWNDGTGQGLQLGFDLGSPKFVLDGTDLYLIGRQQFLVQGYIAKWAYRPRLIYIKSTDSGATWSAPVIIDTYGGAFPGDGGYSSSIVYDGKIATSYYTNDGYDNGIMFNTDHYPYIRVIQNIKEDPNIGSQTKVNLHVAYPVENATLLSVYGKVENGNYSLLGTSPTSKFNLLIDPNVNMTFKVIATVGGSLLSYSYESVNFIYDPRAVQIFTNIETLGETLSTARKTNLHNIITLLRAANLFENQFDAIWIHRNTGLKTTKMNLIQDGYNATGKDNGGLLTFVSGLGYKSDGIYSYLDLNSTDQTLRLYTNSLYQFNSDACYGMKLSGTLPDTGVHAYGNYNDRGVGFKSDGNTHTIRMTCAATAGTKRVIGYNCVSTKDGVLYQMSNDIVATHDLASRNDSGLPIFSLAEYVYPNAVNFEGADVVVEINWVGKHLTPANFLIFQTIMNQLI